MKFKILKEAIVFHTGSFDKDGNAVDVNGLPMVGKRSGDLARRFAPYANKADDDIIDISEYNPFDMAEPDWESKERVDKEEIPGLNGKGTSGNAPRQSQDGKEKPGNQSENSSDGDGESEEDGETEQNGNQSENSQGGHGNGQNQDPRNETIYIDRKTGKEYIKVGNKYVPY